MYPVASSVDIDAYRLMCAGRLREALPLAERAVVDARTCLPAHGFLASLLLQLGRAGDAERAVSTALNLGSGGAEAYDGLAYVSMLLDRHDRANVLYRRAAELSPDVPRYWYNLACSERSLGNLVEAEAACDRCIALDTASYPTYVMRSELRVQAPDANHIVELRARLADAGSDAGARAHLGYALAKELDDVGHFEEAFRWFTAAAQARRSQLTYDVAGDEQKLRRIAEVFPRAVPAPSRGLRSARLQRESRDPRSAGLHGESRDPGSGPLHGGSRDPGSGLLHGRSRDTRSARCIFIVGLPRSGTTLVERILSGLAQVRSNGETDNVSRALTAAARGSGDMFARAAAADPPTVAAHYLRLARVDASSGWVIEKQPTNYLYLGAIRRALPDAKILLVRRAPLDVCFAMFRTMFGGRDAVRNRVRGPGS